MNVPADRNLLFGLVALQNGMIDQSALLAAFHAWTRDKSRSIAEILLGQRAIDADDRTLLDGLVAKHIKRHGDDLEKSLAVVTAPRSVVNGLAALADPEVDATLGHVGSTSHPTEHDAEADSDATASYGSATSDGQRFRILRPHARGGLGAVFVALDAELNREVALKQILDRHADDPTSRMRFVLEAEITGGLEHPGIVPVYGLGNYGDGRPYYAMRFVRGDSLKETIAAFHDDEALQKAPGRRSLALRLLLRRFVDICNAIDYAHNRGVLHRDIKPANVIVGKHGETLVVNWGLAKALGRAEPGAGSDERTLMPSSASGSVETLPGSAMGTPAYMSPEQAVGDLDRLGPRSDVYSLGATLYCLLTGKPPIEADDLGAVLRTVGKGDFPPPRMLDASIDPALEAVCLKAMALKPEDRYATARALAEDVERWAADEPVSAWREPWPRRARRWMRRNRTAVAVASVASLAIVVGLVVVLVVQARANEVLTLANAREKLANVELAAAKDREAARFNLAMDAIGVFHGRISSDFLLKQAEFVPLRDALLNEATDFYRKLEAELGGQSDRRSLRALGLAYLSLGQLTSKVGSLAEAVAQLRRSVEIRRRLAEGTGSDAESRSELGLSLRELAGALHESNSDREAEELYREAIAIFEGLVAEDPTRVAARRDLAKALDHLGYVVLAHDPDAALALARRAAAIQEGLVREDPSDPRRQLALAEGLFSVAYHLSERKREDDKAVATYERSAALYREHIKEGLEGAEDRNVLASIDNNLSNIFERRGRPVERKAAIERMIATRQSVVEMSPGVATFQNNLAHGFRALARFYASSGRIDEALSAYGRGRDLLEAAVKAHPQSLLLRGQLAGNLLGTAWLLYGVDRYAEALEFCLRERTIREAMAADRPSDAGYRNSLANCLTNTAAVLLGLGRLPEAREPADRAVALLESLSRDAPENESYRVTLAEALFQSGQVRQAQGDLAGSAAAWERAVTLYRAIPRPNGEGAFYRGCCHAALAGLAGTPAVREAEAAEAMDLLRRAVATGYRSPSRYRNETALDPLRSRPDFRVLMMDLEFPDDPLAPDG